MKITSDIHRVIHDICMAAVAAWPMALFFCYAVCRSASIADQIIAKEVFSVDE